MKKAILTFLAGAILLGSCTPNYDVVIVGGGASGTTAGIQAARLGAKTYIAEETPWIGGMLTAAGVSAIDGNYRLRGGLFREFTDALADYYGGYEALKTGWVSNILFEPSVGVAVLEKLVAAEPNLTLEKGLIYTGATKLKRGWEVRFKDADGKQKTVRCQILIDGTELGDVARDCGIKYHIGFDPRSYTGEDMAFEEGNDIVQDLTMVMTLKDFGPNGAPLVEKPEGYDSLQFVNCCKNPYNTPVFEKNQPLYDPDFMLSYGALPNGKYMINWPIESNDFYANIIDMSREERDEVIAAAKLKTLGFLYFLQHNLGYTNLGLADDEYPSEDKLAFFPYHRESRRIEGEHLFTLDEARERYRDNAYRTGVAVGDYPVDHHHFGNPDWAILPKMIFAPIPSYTLPAGTLVPLEVEDFIVAEKSISVTNLVNGTTRLQPVVMEIGQVAGVIAALAVDRNCAVRDVDVRSIQTELLKAGAYLQPYLDLKPGAEGFEALQRVSCTGIMRGIGRNVDWSNESWFLAQEPLRWCDLYLEDYYGVPYNPSAQAVSADELNELLISLGAESDEICAGKGQVKRIEAAILIDKWLAPFDRPVDFHGNLL